MTQFALIAAATTGAASTHLDPVKLFLSADIVVQAVMAGLILASVWVWMIVISFMLRMAGVRRRSDAFERDFWKTSDFEALLAEKGKGDSPSARIAAAGLGECKRSTASRAPEPEGTRQRLTAAMDSAIAQEAESLSERINFLATVGAVAPFVGLFGTV